MGSVTLFSSSNIWPSTSSTQTTVQAQATTTTNNSTAQSDSVRLSETARAKLLHSQGEAVQAIASSLGTTSKEIDNDLGITLDEELQKVLQETESAAK
jgi:uncharacterized FlaG/YvyC family protein